jgi:hypothetical protein
MSDLNERIREAKSRLPLPALLGALDLGAHAKKSARCPLHEDRRASFSVWHGAHGWRWKCHAGCGGGDEINFLESFRNLDRGAAIRFYLALAGVRA